MSSSAVRMESIPTAQRGASANTRKSSINLTCMLLIRSVLLNLPSGSFLKMRAFSNRCTAGAACFQNSSRACIRMDKIILKTA
jgi:hypothetical protein